MTSQAIRDKVLAWHGRGYGATDTARQLGLPLEEVRAIIREGDARSSSSNRRCSRNELKYQIKTKPSTRGGGHVSKQPV